MEKLHKESVEEVDRQLYVGWREVVLSKLSERRRNDFLTYSKFILQRIMRDMEKFKRQCRSILSENLPEGIVQMMALCIIEQEREKILEELCKDFEVQYSLSLYDRPGTKENIKNAFKLEFFLYLGCLEAELGERMRESISEKISHELALEEGIESGLIVPPSNPELN